MAQAVAAGLRSVELQARCQKQREAEAVPEEDDGKLLSSREPTPS